MYELAKASRTKLKNKARQMASSSNQKVDSSDWTPAEPLNADIKTGMRPISPRAYKKGGKVMGECEAPRADRVKRKSGGRLLAKEFVDAKVNRNVKTANEQRPGGTAHIGGMKKGGTAKRSKHATNGRVPLPVPRPKNLNEAKIPMPPPRPKSLDEDRDIAENAKMLNQVVDKEYLKDLSAREQQVTPRKSGGAAKKMMGGPTMADQRGNMVKPNRMQFAGSGQGTPYKKGGKAAKHPDEAMDKALIKKMVKPEARKGKNVGGVLGGLIPMAIESMGNKDKDKDEKKNGGRAARKEGGGVFTGPGYPGKIPGVISGGRTARKAGGKAGKGKTNINIVIATGKGQPDDMNMPMKGLPPQLPQRMPVLAPAPSPMPPMGAGAMSPPGMPPMPASGLGGPPGMPPMGRKAGGRITKIAKSYKDMEAGAGGGEGRIQKTDITKTGKGSPTFKKGGKVYRSYKDMDAGAGSGEGRLEKTDIQHGKRVH